MRVLVVTPLLPHAGARNAGALVVRDQLAALAAEHTVTLATFADPTPRERDAVAAWRAAGVDVRPVWRIRSRGVAARWRRRLVLARNWLGGRNPLLALEFADPRMQLLLDGLESELHFDLLEVVHSLMGGYRLPHACSTPALLIDLEVATIPADDRARGTIGFRRRIALAERRRWRHYLCRVWPRFARIQVFTQEDATACTALAPELAQRVRVNPFGIAPPVEPMDETGADEVADSIVFVGGFAHAPNVDAARWLASAIMPRVRALRPGAQLSIVGADPPSAVRALAADDVAVTGSVPHVEPYLRRAAVVVAPLRDGGGMRLKVLQAMAHGKAVVTTTRGAAGLRTVGVPPPLVIADDAETFARAVAQLLAEPALRRDHGLRARDFVARHSSPAVYLRRLDALRRETLASSASAAGVPR